MTDLSDWRTFLVLLDYERLLRVRELRCLHATTLRPAKEIYGTKLYRKMVQFSESEAPSKCQSTDSAQTRLQLYRVQYHIVDLNRNSRLQPENER